MEDNLFTINKNTFDLHDSITNTIKIFEKVVEKSKSIIKFVFTDYRSNYFIRADKARIEQVISNLMHNSLKSITRSRHQNGDGKISIIVRNKGRKLKNNSGQNISKTEPTVEIIVDDNGQGIDPKIMSILFEKFTKSLDGMVWDYISLKR
jgi:signal transduction histidine kinase